MSMVEVDFTNENPKDYQKKLTAEMDKSIQHFERELAAIRTGRANPAMVEDVKIACYGGTTELKLKELAAISAPDARLIIIQPWDISTLSDIDKGLQESDIGITPANDGEVIRLQLPEMSGARRDELVKILGKKEEESKIAVRNSRKEYQNLVRDAQKAKQISEDFGKRLTDLLEKTTTDFIKKIDVLAEKKRAEIKAF
ncbi:MAG: Ribosome-recycling factor [candidate division TM6 bacterium GW2011_GWF2_32_72]|nr:MAG: Ribosome-recycling factor [candidate division TM6 bacterium GW2011_GWF2_32_72]